MRMVSLFVVTLLLAPAGRLNAADKPDPKSELKKLQGTWQMDKMEVDGKAFGDPTRQKVVILGNEFIMMLDSAARNKFIITIDPAKDPKTIDLRVTIGAIGGTSLGIYRWVSDDEIEICRNQPMGKGSDKRPTAFTTKLEEGAGSLLFVLKRVKK